MKAEPNNSALWRELNNWIKERTGWINTEAGAREVWSAFLNGHTLIIINCGYGIGIAVLNKNCGLHD